MIIAVIGTGSMGGALARHFAKGHSVLLCNREPQKAEDLARKIGAVYVDNLREAVQRADVIVLAVKPKDLQDVAHEIAAILNPKQIAISVLAGTSIATLQKSLPQASIVRIMPNLALTCGQGIIGLVDDPFLSSEIKKIVGSLLEELGLLYWLSEDKMEAFTALCSSAPAFVFVILEAMIEGGVKMGFPYKDAEELVLKTFEGALTLLRETKKHPMELAKQIASPGGTTMAGLKVMEERSIGEGLWQALLASYQRGIQMLEEFKK